MNESYTNYTTRFPVSARHRQGDATTITMDLAVNKPPALGGLVNEGNRAATGDAPPGPGFTFNKAGGYGVLLARCNCCGGMLHLNVTRHGYVTFDCENLGDANRAPCKHARHAGKDAGDWIWRCVCPSHKLDRVCPNKSETARDEREKIQGLIETVVYTAAMSRNFVILDLRDSDYVDFEPAVLDAVNMSFTIDGVPNQRPYFVLVRRFYRAGENVSSRFVFLKRSIPRSMLFRYAKILLSLVARLAKRLPGLEGIAGRYEIA